MSNAVFVGLGWLCIVLGVIGAFLPIMPTTPFIILAAFFFSRGNKRLHEWLLNNKHFGKQLRDWEEKGVISKRAKYMATFGIACLFTSTLVFVDVVTTIKIIILLVGASVLLFIWTRPSS